MITRAYVEEVVDKTLVRVRIPIFNKIKSAAGATPTQNLPTAVLCTIPSCIMNPKVNDVVIVGFEEDTYSRPIVLGYLFSDNMQETLCDLTLSSLVLKGNCKLSTDTSIGEVSAEDIKQLKDTKGNIQQQLDLLSQRISQLGG